ncbi:sulfite exporter TauE/SafE family protein [Fundicoccus sp. Sow4_D5]|uniref:sulfite exporter TauE/SafE family protein n=1 Tax=unclassified Fundicoccus TaxID=2761543 RepID=UPI003F904196
MTLTFIYTVIVLLATTIGAVTGLGGGVIIKPLFDLLGADTPTVIGFYSSVAVFTMCLVSIYKQIRKGFQFNGPILIGVSAGSLVGGYLGESLFSIATQSLSDAMVQRIQASLLLATLMIILIYAFNKHRIKHYQVNHWLLAVGVGVFLGTISVFLGIGGGPLNVSLLMWLMSFSMKNAAVYSIATIFFSQLSKLGSMALSGELFEFDFSLLPFIIVAAIIGGYMGTLINQKLTNQRIENLYNALMIVLMFISVLNIYQTF